MSRNCLKLLRIVSLFPKIDAEKAQQPNFTLIREASTLSAASETTPRQKRHGMRRRSNRRSSPKRRRPNNAQSAPEGRFRNLKPKVAGTAKPPTDKPARYPRRTKLHPIAAGAPAAQATKIIRRTSSIKDRFKPPPKARKRSSKRRLNKLSKPIGKRLRRASSTHQKDTLRPARISRRNRSSDKA